MSLADERAALSAVAMKDSEDPKKLFKRLKAVEVRFNTLTHKIKQEDLMAFILSQSPKAYQAVLTAEHRTKGASITTADLEDAMNQHYRLLRKGKTEQEDDKIALTTFDRKCLRKARISSKGFSIKEEEEVQWKMSQLRQGRTQGSILLDEDGEQEQEASMVQGYK